jgi:hypothetical protein
MTIKTFLDDSKRKNRAQIERGGRAREMLCNVISQGGNRKGKGEPSSVLRAAFVSVSLPSDEWTEC